MNPTPRADVQRFLSETRFDGYQAVPLPHGLTMPGNDCAARADHILADRVEGRTLLDVGTAYGAFPHAALRLGASAVTGVEPDAHRVAVAQRIAELNGGQVEVVAGGLDALAPDRRFDVVTCLRVLHHVVDPVTFVAGLAARARQLVILEFGLVDDPQYLREITGLGEIGARLASPLVRLLAARIPLAAVGGREYHRSWYFSRRAFHNLFVVHHPVFADVTFLPGSSSRRQAVALCYPHAEKTSEVFTPPNAKLLFNATAT